MVVHDQDPECHAGKKRVAATSVGQDIVSFVNVWNLI